MTAYLLFLAAHAVLVVRPSELIPGADGVQFYLPLIAAATLTSMPRLVHLGQPKTLINQPVAAAVFGLVAMSFVSHMSNGAFVEAIESSEAMMKTAVYLLVMICVITTPQRMRTFLLTTVLSASLMIAASIVSYEHFVETWSDQAETNLLEAYRDDRMRPLSERVLTHVVEFEDIDDTNRRQVFFRMRGFGIFGDPNDLSTLIVFSFVMTLYFLNDRRAGPLRFLWLLNLWLLFYAQSCTQSRGGLLAAAVAAAVFLLMKYGRKVATVLILLMVAAVPLLAGRLASLSFEEGTAQERIQLWADGFKQLQTGRAIFGIGAGNYTEISGTGLKAHNSWIHAFVELGLVGGMMFFACVFFSALGFYRIRRAGHQPRDPTLRGLLPYVPAVLAGLCFALCTLSRCYTPATYMVFGTAAVYLNLVGYELFPPQPIVRLSRWTMLLCSVYGLSFLLAAFLFVKVFVRF